MKQICMLMMLLSIPYAAIAGCNSQSFGDTTFSNCDDGSSYTTNRFGDSSTTQGYNSNTGNSWYSQTQNYGDTSTTYGSDANGNSWNSTTIQSGNMSTTYGTDSDGEPFSTTCNTIDNNTYCY